jgi:cell division septum initiation protein DivIVA
MKTLTIKHLKSLGACRDTLDFLKAKFGAESLVTVAICESVAQEIDWDWAVQHLLSDPARAEYKRVTDRARLEYERATGPAQAEYNHARDQAEYTRARDLAQAEYEHVRDLARVEYERATSRAWVEYKRVKAHTFALLYAKEK